jgi:hypothetical protein
MQPEKTALNVVVMLVWRWYELLKSPVFCDAVLCRVIYRQQQLRGACYIHLQGGLGVPLDPLKMEAANSP